MNENNKFKKESPYTATPIPKTSNRYVSEQWRTYEQQEEIFKKRYTSSDHQYSWKPFPQKEKVPVRRKVKDGYVDWLPIPEVEPPACMWCGEEFPSESVRDEHEEHCAD